MRNKHILYLFAYQLYRSTSKTLKGIEAMNMLKKTSQ